MKKKKHPIYRKNLLLLTNGATYTAQFGGNKKNLKLDLDFNTHYLWTGIKKTLGRGTQLTKFKKRYQKI